MWIDYSVMENCSQVLLCQSVGRSQPAVDISMYVLGPIYITFLPPSGYLKKNIPTYTTVGP